MIQVKIAETEESSRSYSAIIASTELLKTETSLELSEVKTEIESLEKKKQDLSAEDLQLEIERQKLKNTQGEVEIIHKQLEMKLVSSVECPGCKLVFNPNSKETVDVVKIKDTISVAVSYLSKLEKDISQVQAKETQVSTKLILLKTEINKKSIEKSRLSNEIVRLEGIILTNNTRIDTCTSLVSDLTKSINSVQEVDISTIIRDLRKKSNEEVEKKLVYEKEKLKLEEEVEKSSYWIVTFTRFKTHLSNKVIKVIECFINEYLGRMSTDVRIQIDGYKMNKDNTIKESISVSLHRDGEDASLSTFSNGERARVEIAAIFAIQKLINTSIQESSSTGGLEFTFLDEIIDSVDSLGMFNIMKTLQTLKKTISVVSHVTFKEHSENLFNTVTVEKENKISIIK